MSNNRSTKSELDQIKRTFRARQLEHQRECEHHSNREYYARPLNTSKNFRRGDDQYPETTFRCEECGKIFDGDSFTRERTEDAIWVIEGMLEQLKIMGDLNDKQHDEIVATIEALETIKQMEIYYHDLYKKSDRNDNKNKSNNNRKSSIGATRSMFNGAGRR